MKIYCPSCARAQTSEDIVICPFCGSLMNVENEASELPVGTVLANRYWIGRRIGRGGFGITYVACDMRLDLKLAVKEFFPSSISTRMSEHSLNVSLVTESDSFLFMQQKKSFVREAETLAGLAAEVNIVRVCDIVSENNTSYIVMEYIDGVTLGTYHEKKGNLPFKEAYQLLRPVIAVLQRVHDSGILHRDISPSNIMIGDNGVVKLLDFGSARVYDNSDVKSMTIILKQGYAPPEQYYRHGEQGPWTDIYAVCATIYYLITGVVPQNSIERVLLDELKKPTELGAEITEKEEEVLLQGMSIDVRQRIRSADTLLDAFDHVGWDNTNNNVSKGSLSQASIQKTEVVKEQDNHTVVDKEEHQRRFPKSVLAVTAALMIVLLSAAGYILSGKSDKQDVAAEALTSEAQDTTQTDPVSAAQAETVSAQADRVLPKAKPEKYYYHDGHTYGFYDASRYGFTSYDEVSDFCHEQGGHLAVINDNPENSFLYDLVKENYKTTAFFGYTDQEEEGTWVWDGDKSDYENWTRGGDWDLPDNGERWGGGEQMNSGEDYAEFNYDNDTNWGAPNDSTWNDAAFMENTKIFICEWEFIIEEA